MAWLRSNPSHQLRFKGHHGGRTPEESETWVGIMQSMNSGVSYARLDPDTEERFVSLRRDLGVTSFGLNQILLRPGQRGRIHRHTTQEEVYLVLAGTLSLWIEGEEKRLGQGEIVRVAPEVRRQLANRGDEDCCCSRSAAHGEHVGRDGEAFESWEQQTGAPPQEVPLPADER